MRPDEEMLAGVEEVELEPCDLFTYLGTLIIEGRVPGLSERGYGEGPHCPPLSGQSRHVCDASSSECQQQEQLEKHMLLLWKNGIPLSVEVLLYPECCLNALPGRSVQVETSSAPETGPCVLLEQWTLHMLHRRLADASIPPRGLIQAVRSFLHFSQLSAWLSLSKGKNNLNIHYRLCVPGEAFSSKFDQEPNYHSFPVANVGRSAMKILVKSLPRCSTIPQVPCLKHNLSALNSAVQQMPSVFPSASPGGLRTEAEPFSDKLCKNMKDVPNCASSAFSDLASNANRSSTPVEPSLGESLLDPPQSLQMYPKRYQSPSRCGSPSLEAPEHLLFRPGPSARREPESRARLNPSTRDRSRPQRRPVVERFLKKEYGAANSPSLPCDRLVTHDKMKTMLEDKVGNSADLGLKNSVLYPAFTTQLPNDEMEMVLNQLRHRYPPSSKVVPEEPRDVEEKYLLNSIWLKQEAMKQESLKRMNVNDKGPLNVRNVPAMKLKAMCLKNSSDLIQDSGVSHKPFHEQSSPSQQQPPSLPFSSLSSTYFCSHSKPNDIHPNSSPAPPINESQSSANHLPCSVYVPPGQHDQSEAVLLGILNKGCHIPPTSPDFDNQDETACEELRDQCNSLSSERFGQEQRTKCEEGHRAFKNQNLCLRLNSQTDRDKSLTARTQVLPDSENLDKNVAIPSSADKLKFRRSLDSATSMVFHQNTGLPLTSSPAPIRKSGTCFDFDSSLTSVSAIKKALFEKDPESDNNASPKSLLSTSAPSSITTNNLLGNFEESVLNGRLEPVSTVEGFTAEIGASGSFCPRHRTLPVTVFFYTLHDIHKITSPYLGHINLGHKGYYVPKKGTVQVTLFNPHRTVVKMFVVRYDLSDMPPSCQTFLRQRTLYMPTDAHEDDVDSRKWLRYLIHLRFASSKSGKIYLHTDVRMIVFRKSDLDAATIHGQRPYELRSFTQEPVNPKFSPYK